MRKGNKTIVLLAVCCLMLSGYDGQAARMPEATPVEGTVLQPDGTPAAEATVALGEPGDWVTVGDGAFRHIEKTVHAVTDREGRFVFSAETIDAFYANQNSRSQSGPQRDSATATPAFLMVVLHDSGHAKADRTGWEANPVITLQPFGRVEGTFLYKGMPAAEQTVRVSLHQRFSSVRPNLAVYYKVDTQDDGRFSVEHAISGTFYSVHVAMTSEYRGQVYFGDFFEVTPGETTTIVIGGKGCPVHGRLLVPEDGPEVDWENSMLRMMEDIPMPTMPEGLDEAQQAAWREEQQNKQEMHRVYDFAWQPDGSIAIDNDVPPGAYAFMINLFAFADNPRNPWDHGDCLYQGKLNIAIPEFPEGRSDEPLELGEIPLTRLRELQPGERAPDFEAPSLDGEMIRLGDLRGKYVLAYFTATWCSPCHGILPFLQEIYSAYGDHPRFVLLGLSLDKDMETYRDYVKKNDLPWMHLYLGEWDKTLVPAQYGVQGIPDLFLIGPEGRIVSLEPDAGTALRVRVGHMLNQISSSVTGKEPKSLPEARLMAVLHDVLKD